MPAVVVYESLYSDSVHEQIRVRPCGPDVLGQNLTSEDGNLHHRQAFLIEVREAQQHPHDGVMRTYDWPVDFMDFR